MDNLAAGACRFISFCKLTPEAQAAWAQAVFSVLGIGVAIWIPWHLRHAEQKDQKRKDADVSRDLALFLLPAIQHWREQWSASPEPGERWYHAAFNESYRVPAEIAGAVERLHLLGRAARYLQTAVFLARELEGRRQELRAHVRGDHDILGPPTSETPKWEAKLDRLYGNLEGAEREMRALFDEGAAK